MLEQKKQINNVLIFKAKEDILLNKRVVFLNMQEARNALRASFEGLHWIAIDDRIDCQIELGFGKIVGHLKEVKAGSGYSLDFSVPKNDVILLYFIKLFCSKNYLFAYDISSKKILPNILSEPAINIGQEFKERMIKCIQHAYPFRKEKIIEAYPKVKSPVMLLTKRGRERRKLVTSLHDEITNETYSLTSIDSLALLWDFYGLSKYFEQLTDTRFHTEDQANCIYKWIKLLFLDTPNLKVLESEVMEQRRPYVDMMNNSDFRIDFGNWYGALPTMLVERYEEKFQKCKEFIQASRK